MSLNEINFQKSYSLGSSKDITTDFLIPALNESIIYKRSVGYFTCNSILHLSQGVKGIIKNGGKIQIITSPNLSEKDIDLINKGYAQREKVFNEVLIKQIEQEDMNVSLEMLEDIVPLIEKGFIEIKIVIRDNLGLYHDKVGILEDNNANKVCFVGSLNETFSAYTTNYEKIRVFTNWESESDSVRVKEEEQEFDNIWQGIHKYIETYDFPEAAKNKIINKFIETLERKKIKEQKTKYEKRLSEGPIKLRNYQIKAKEAWINNNYNGFFEMATGTGKTWTALYSIKELFENQEAITTIVVAPYIHLIEQWHEDVKKVFGEIDTVRISSTFKNWETTLSNKVNLKKYNNRKDHLIILTTQASFNLPRFRRLIKRMPDQKLLVVDEAHRFFNMISKTDIDYKYKLGLSATPQFNKNIEKSQKLVDYFGGVVFKYTLEDALGKYLVNYEYHPFFVHLNEIEELKFKKAQAKIASCFKSGKMICDSEKFTMYLRQRNVILARAEEKEDKKLSFIEQIPIKQNLIVYSGDGFINPDHRHIDQLTRELYDEGYRVHKFTSSETLKERIEMITDFTDKKIDVLAAIKCLDEGVNIPSIKAALLLASNNDSKEFIQRRGRILRMHDNKDKAYIYDVIVLPINPDVSGVAALELKRYHEYARLALNNKELMKEFDKLLEHYGLAEDDVIIEEFDLEDRKDVLDD